jgi:hypothetical protein
MVNPVFFQDDDVAMLSSWARLLFINLWCLADRAGRLEDKPLRIKAQTFPFDADVDVAGNLDELAEQGFIHRYTVAGKKYIQVKNFLKYQRPHHREPASDIPERAPESPGEAVPRPVLSAAEPGNESLLPVESITVSITESVSITEPTEPPAPPPATEALVLTSMAVTKATEWNREAADDFREVYRADPPKLFFAHVKPVAQQYGWARTRPALRAYMEETPIEFLAIPKCLASKVANFGAQPRAAPASARARQRTDGMRALVEGGLKGDGTV